MRVNQTENVDNGLSKRPQPRWQVTGLWIATHTSWLTASARTLICLFKSEVNQTMPLYHTEPPASILDPALGHGWTKQAFRVPIVI